MAGLKYYPRIREYLEKEVSSCSGRTLYKDQPKLVGQVQDCIVSLKRQEVTVTWHTVAETLNRSIGSLKYYPEVRKLMSVHVERNDIREQYAYELDILKNVRTAINALQREGKAITERSVADSIGMSQSGLRYYPHVLEFLRRAAVTINHPSSKSRQEPEPKVQAD